MPSFQNSRISRALPVAIALLSLPGILHAQATNPNVTIDQSLSSMVQNSTINLLDLGTASFNGLVSNNNISFGDGNTINFSGTAGIYHGGVRGVAAAPWTGNGIETRNYFAAGPSGPVTFNFGTSQKYFGINWGSVDGYNSLSFYQNGALVETITGSRVVANPSGAQNASGSYMLNITFNGATAFDQVVLRSTSPAFEFNVVGYAPTAVTNNVNYSAPPTTVALLDLRTNTFLGSPAPLPGLAGTPIGMMALFAAGGLILRRRRIT
jgi:hypothetical protein